MQKQRKACKDTQFILPIMAFSKEMLNGTWRDALWNEGPEKWSEAQVQRYCVRTENQKHVRNKRKVRMDSALNGFRTNCMFKNVIQYSPPYDSLIAAQPNRLIIS